MRFMLASADSIKVKDEYRSGMRVVFQPTLGPKSMQPIAIDLVVDEAPLERTELVSPTNRIDVKGLQVCDYLVYSVENALADKLCSLVERHDGRASSRVKDLVDIAVYAVACSIDGRKLRECVLRRAPCVTSPCLRRSASQMNGESLMHGSSGSCVLRRVCPIRFGSLTRQSNSRADFSILCLPVLQIA